MLLIVVQQICGPMNRLKHLLRLLLVIIPISSSAQFTEASYSISPEGNQFITPDSLARYLTAPYQKDTDKVQAIFTWITDNIEYNVKRYRTGASRFKMVPVNDDDSGALKPLSERVAIDVLKKRRAFCDGYARLFQTLCNYAGIRCEVVTGYANGGYETPRSFCSNHRWNAVYFDSTWHLVDPTFASGYVTFSGDFIRQYNGQYFLADPATFARDHFPEDLQWTLLANPYLLPEFRHSPFKTFSFYKYDINAISPSSGIIDATLGDTLQFAIETKQKHKLLFVSDSCTVDSAVIASAPDTLKEAGKTTGDILSCQYLVTNQNAQWLTVIYGDEVILRYKLNISKEAGSKH